MPKITLLSKLGREASQERERERVGGVAPCSQARRLKKMSEFFFFDFFFILLVWPFLFQIMI
jgi:hypothetical protein